MFCSAARVRGKRGHGEAGCSKRKWDTHRYELNFSDEDHKHE